MAKTSNPTSVKSILILSAIAAALVGFIVFFGVRPQDAAGNIDQIARLSGAAIWAGLSFIVIIISIATLRLTVKDDPRDPDQPALK
jgi:multisubunit Na+/H+ antiporter MnhB subunit